MSSVLQFLESIGRGTALTAQEYASAVSALDVDEVSTRALLDIDQLALNELLHGRSAMVCFIATPDDQEQEAPDGDDDGIPDKEDDSPLERE